MAIETIFKNIADAIREKAGTSGLITPAQMPQAIADIPSGGGGLQLETPLHEDIHDGYVSDGVFYHSVESSLYSDVYLLQQNHLYILFKKQLSSRFRAVQIATDPTTVTYDIYGIRAMSYYYSNGSTHYTMITDSTANIIASGNTTPSLQYANMICNPPFMYPNDNYPYLVITKSNTGQSGIKTYLLDVTSV